MRRTILDHCKLHSPIQQIADLNETILSLQHQVVEVTNILDYYKDECVTVPIEKITELTPDCTRGVCFVQPPDATHEDETVFVIVREEKYRDLLEQSTLLKSIVNRDSVNTIMINTGHIDKTKLKDAHSEQICKLELRLSEQKNKYSKIHGLYTHSINQIVELKRKLTESNTVRNQLEQNKKHYTTTENIKRCLMDYQVLDDFIKEKVYESTGARRNTYNKCGINEFVSLPNVNRVLEGLDITATDFKTKYDIIRRHRIAVAHPTTCLDKSTLRRTILNRLIVPISLD
jgi:hypothetical protein